MVYVLIAVDWIESIIIIIIYYSIDIDKIEFDAIAFRWIRFAFELLTIHVCVCVWLVNGDIPYIFKWDVQWALEIFWVNWRCKWSECVDKIGVQ